VGLQEGACKQGSKTGLENPTNRSCQDVRAAVFSLSNFWLSLLGKAYDMLRINPASLDWALAHARKYGDTDVFPLPFEYDAIHHNWAEVRSYLSSQDVLEWEVRPHRSLLAPKAKYGFRVITQLDPLDFLLFAAIVFEMAQDLEGARVSPANLRVFSYRYNPDSDGRLFDPTIGYPKFQSTCRAILDRHDQITHVVTTDISDFYCRIYHHRLENSLNASTSKANHVKAVRHLLSGWNGTETFGIPVGSAPSRLLAETAISDVDEALLANGVRFIRFNDDFRIFANSHSEAYRHLAFLAEVLFSNHGLTLQQQKTTVLPTSEFRQRYLADPEDRELDSLQERFLTLLRDLGISDPYQEIYYDDLSDEAKATIDSMNLVSMFEDEADKDEPDLPTLRFLLRRLGQLGDSNIVDRVLGDLDKLHPVFPDIIRYLASLRDLSAGRRSEIGGSVLRLLEDSIISELDYHRLWALDLFSKNTDWNNEQSFFQLLNTIGSRPGQRKIILAMGRAHQRHWFQSQWRNLFDNPPWSKRALLAAASCMPPDARKHWYNSLSGRLDALENSIVRWARQNPF
jgi:Reverse transcriptase (RNA-dependent DNA polymerase)